MKKESLLVVREKQQQIFRQFVERELRDLETNRELHRQYVLGIVHGKSHWVEQLELLEHLLYRMIDSSYSKHWKHAKCLMILYVERKNTFVNNIVQENSTQ